MKWKRMIWIGAGIVLFVIPVVVYWWMKNQNENATQTTETEEREEVETILDMAQEEIVTVSYTFNDEEIIWNKEEGSWKLESDEYFPTDNSSINDMISTLTALTSERTLEKIENLKDYGLQNPLKRVSLKDEGGNEETISVGSVNPSTQCTYLYVNNETSTIYTVKEDLNEVLSEDVMDYAVSEEYTMISSANIYEVSFEKDKNSFTLTKDADSSNGWYVKDAKGNKEEANSTMVSSVQSSIGGLEFSQYYDYHCEDFSEYGLDDPVMIIEVKYIEEVKDAQVTSENVDKSVTLSVGDLNEDGTYYVRMNNSEEVHGISQGTLNVFINGRAFEYWKLSVDSIAIGDLDYLKIMYDDETYILKRTAEETLTESEGNPMYFVNDVEVDPVMFMEFYQSSVEVECQNRLEETQKVKNPELVLEYHGINGIIIKNSYMARDSSFYTVVDQDGDSGLVNKMTVKNLITQFIKMINETEE